MQRRRSHLPRPLLGLARRQGGVLTTKQLDDHGVTRRIRSRMLADHSLHRHHDQTGIYWLDPTTTPRGMAWAGLLLGGAGSALGGWHALALSGARVPPQRLRDALDIWVPRERFLYDKGPWRFRRDCAGRLRGADRLDSRDPWLIPGEHALLDVAGALSEDACMGLTLDLLRDQQVHPARLDAVLQQRRHRHRVVLRTALTDHLAGVESVLEQRYAHDVEQRHGLPAGRRQAQLADGRCDVLYAEQQLVVELDGRRYHHDRFRDARRDNAHALDGYETLRYGWHDVVHDPCLVANQVAARLAARGWSGTARRCPRCPG